MSDGTAGDGSVGALPAAGRGPAPPGGHAGARSRTVRHGAAAVGCAGRPSMALRRCHLARRAATVLVLAVAGVGFGAGAAAPAADGVPVPVLVKASRGAACVEPVPVIRRDHMKFLVHQRDDTVHGGIRGARHSLVGCIDCHAARDEAGRWARIDAPGQFCASCHEYVAVKIDCFGCHAAVPAVAFREAAE